MKKSSALILTSLILTIMLTSFVLAETNLNNLLGKIGGTNFEFTPGVGFAKILMFVLIALVVFAIAEYLPFIGEKNWVAGAISIVIALLSITYLNTEEVYTILLSYSALGIALTSIIPFFVIMAVSRKLYDSGQILFSKILWIVFGVIIIIKWLLAPTMQAGWWGFWIYLITGIAILIMILFGDKIHGAIFKGETKEAVGGFKRMQELIREGDKAKAEEYSKTLPMNAGIKKNIENAIGRMK